MRGSTVPMGLYLLDYRRRRRSDRPDAQRRGPLAGLAVAAVVGLLGIKALAGEESTPAPAAATTPAASPAAEKASAKPAKDEKASEMADALEDAIADLENEVDDDQRVEHDNHGPALKPVSAELPQYDTLEPLSAVDDYLSRAFLGPDGRYHVETEQGRRTLTIVPELQKKLNVLLRQQKIPYGAVAAIEPSTGRVLALAEHSEERPDLRGLNLRAIYPAASLFKIVTGAALLEAGIPADERVCYHGGKRRLQRKLLQDSKRDYRCMSFSDAMAYSANVVFAKLAVRALQPPQLRAWAERFGFNRALPFAQPVQFSPAVIPDEEFDFARTAAGFGDVLMSPLHAAFVAAAVGNQGLGKTPVLFEDERAETRQVVDAPTAQALSEMLEGSVTQGTARRAFRERGRYVLGDVTAAGKTGSLADYDTPFRDFTWFSGYAPKENPKIAVAAVMVNGRFWKVKGPYVAREAMRLYLNPPKKVAKKSVATSRPVKARRGAHRK